MFTLYDKVIQIDINPLTSLATPLGVLTSNDSIFSALITDLKDPNTSDSILS